MRLYGPGITISDAPPVQYTVTATAGAGGTATPGTQQVNENATGNVLVTPNAGFQVTAISGCGGTAAGLPSGAAVNYTTGPITAACTVTATFAAVPAPVLSSYPRQRHHAELQRCAG
jgi:hypothetical protein